MPPFNVRRLFGLTALLIALACAPRAEADAEQDWLDRFAFLPPAQGSIAPEGTSTELPTFTVTPQQAGPQLLRVSLPFTPRAWMDSEALAIVPPSGKLIAPQVRVLTRHGGPATFVRRAMISFLYDFPSTDAIHFSCVRATGEVSELPTWSIRHDGNALIATYDGHDYNFRSDAPPISSSLVGFEIIEQGPYFQWARLLIADAQFPRIIELKAGANGTIEYAVHLQNMSEKMGYAPDFGIAHDGGGVQSTDHYPHQYAAWRSVGGSARVQEGALIDETMPASIAIPDSYFGLYPETTTLPDLSAWPELISLLAFHREAMANAGMPDPDKGNVGNMPAAGAFGMNRLNHCPAIFQEYYLSGDARIRDAAVAWCDNFYDLSLWWDVADTNGFGGTRYNNLAASDSTFTQDPAYMWRSNSAVHFCTKGYDSFLYAYEETGDPRFATALRWQVDYAKRMVHVDQGEARNIGDARDFVRLYEMTGEQEFLDHALRLFRELRTKLSTGDLFSQSGAPLEDNPPFIDDDAFGYNHPFAKPYIIGYALSGLPALAKYHPDEPKLRDVIRAVADLLARTVDPVGGWRYPHPDSSYVIVGQGMEHAAQLSRAAAYLESRGEDIDNLIEAIEIVLQSRLNMYLVTGQFFGGLGGWEAATKSIPEGKTLHDLYKLPSDRDKSRDYTEGSVGIGPHNSPDGTVYFSEVLAFYLKHRPAERLLNTRREFQQVSLRAEKTPQPLRIGKPSSETGFGMAERLPSFAEERIAEMEFPLARRNNMDKPFPEWRAEARAKLLECLGPPPPRMEFMPKTEAKEDRGTYLAFRMELNLSAWYRVSAYVLQPKGDGPFPAVLALHDHGAHFSIGKEKVIRPIDATPEVMADAQDWVNKSYGGKWFGDELAERGYVVLAIDALFWGERGRAEGVDYEAQQELAANLFQLGLTWPGIITWDDIRSAEFLAVAPKVDPTRITAVGLSMGAHRAWMLCAATDLVSAGMAICWLGDTPTLMAPGNNQTRGQSAFSMLLPGLRNYLDYPDVASIACPKPMLFYNGTQDTLFPTPGVEAAYQILQQVYESQGVGEKLETRLWDVPHEFNEEMQAAAWEWMEK